MTDNQAKLKSLARLRQKQNRIDKDHRDIVARAMVALVETMVITAEVPEHLRFPMDLFFNVNSPVVRRR